MDFDKEKQTVTIFTRVFKLDTLATRLSGLNGSQVRGFFENRGMMLPRKMSCMALISVLNERIKTLTSDKLKKDYFTRLQYYKTFSELQLLNLYSAISNAEDFKQLRINFWKLVLINFVGLNLSDGEIQYLITLKKLPMESFDDYYDVISEISCEQTNTFDGQDKDVMQENLTKSASAAEMQQYAEKYGLEVPQRLNKAQLAEFAYDAVKDDKRQPTDIKEKLENMNLTQLNNFCKEWRIDMQSAMTKQQAVTYMFFYLGQCEILTTSLKVIESLPMYEPLEFRVDLSVATPFGSKEAKKIIYYEDEEEKEEDAPLSEEPAVEETPAPAPQVKKAVIAKAVAPAFAKNAKRTVATPSEEEKKEEPVKENKALDAEAAKQEDIIISAEPQKEFNYEADQPAGEKEEAKEDNSKADFVAASAVLASAEEAPEEEPVAEETAEEAPEEEPVAEETAEETPEEEPVAEETAEETSEEEPVAEETIEEAPEEEPVAEETAEETPEEEPVAEETAEETSEEDALEEELLAAVPEKQEEMQQLSFDEERLGLILRNLDISKFIDKKVEKLPENAIPIGEVKENNEFGSKELLKLKKSKKGLVIGLIITAVILAGAGFALWYFVFRR